MCVYLFGLSSYIYELFKKKSNMSNWLLHSSNVMSLWVKEVFPLCFCFITAFIKPSVIKFTVWDNFTNTNLWNTDYKNYVASIHFTFLHTMLHFLVLLHLAPGIQEEVVFISVRRDLVMKHPAPSFMLSLPRLCGRKQRIPRWWKHILMRVQVSESVAAQEICPN